MADRVIELLVKVKDDGSKELTNLGKAFVATAGMAGAAMMKFAVDAAPLEGVEGAFEGIAVASGESADEMLAALERGSAGMIAQRDLMMTYNQAAQLVSTTFANELPEAMGYLGKVSAATGQDMGFMLDSLVKGVGRLSPAILDNLSIQVTLADATARASEMYGVQADALTKAQTQAGMMSVTMEKLRENTAAMPEVAGSAAQQIAEFQAELTNLRDAAGTMALPALKAVLGVVNSLEPSTMALAIGLGSAATAAVKFGGGLGGLATKLGTTQMGLVAAGAAVAAWVVAWEKWEDLEKTVEQGIEDSSTAISTWTDEARTMIGEGEDITAVVGNMSDKVKAANDAFHADGNVLEDVATAYARTRGEAQVMTEAQEEIHGIVLTSTSSWGEYSAALQQYNTDVAGTQAEIEGLTQAEYEAGLARREGLLALFEQARAVSAQVEAVESSDRAMLGYIDAQKSAATVSWEVAEAQHRQAEAQRQEQATADMAAASMQRQAEAAGRVAEMQRQMAEAAAAAAETTAGLAASLMDATDAQIANTLTGMLDPQAMGAEAFLSAATEIGTTFGTMDAESIALADTLPKLAEALNQQVVPADQADEALSALITDAADGKVAFSDLVTEFGNAPEPMRAVTERTRDVITELDKVEASGFAARDGLADARDAAWRAKLKMDEAQTGAEKLATQLDNLAGDYVINVDVNTAGSLPEVPGGGGGNIPAFQSGGIVPGPLGRPRLIVAHGGEEVVPRDRRGGTTVVIDGPLIGNASVRSDDDVRQLADLVASELAARVSLRGAFG